MNCANICAKASSATPEAMMCELWYKYIGIGMNNKYNIHNNNIQRYIIHYKYCICAVGLYVIAHTIQ